MVGGDSHWSIGRTLCGMVLVVSGAGWNARAGWRTDVAIVVFIASHAAGNVVE